MSADVDGHGLIGVRLLMFGVDVEGGSSKDDRLLRIDGLRDDISR